MPEKTIEYSIDTEVPETYLQSMFDFIYQKYILPQKNRFANVSRKTVENHPLLTYDALDISRKQRFNVELVGTSPINMKITPMTQGVTDAEVEEARQDIVIFVELFEEQARTTTLYFAWREGEEIVPEETSGKEKKPINRLFLETQILLFILFITVGMFLFFGIGSFAPGLLWIVPILLLAIQFVFVFYSNRLIAATGDWKITENNPSIHLLEYHLPIKEHEDFKQTFPKEKLMEIKKEIYEETISKKGEIDCETAHKVFSKHGFACNPEAFTSKKVNVYQLVKRTADKFGFPMPRIVVSNTMVPNAAASGPSPSRGVVLITTGLLVQLKDDEILSVLGHEFGHLKGRDPLLLYGLTGGEFLLRFYVFLPLFPVIFLSYLFFLYFWAVMMVIYFISKFFEARADLVSAIVIGQPKILAEALEKIGFKRLLMERTPSFRFQEWIGLEPHPPIYFRVKRLEKLTIPVKIKYPLIRSIKDVANEFMASF